MKLLIRARNSRGEMSVKDDPLGRGGEGAVYSVLSHTVPSLPSADSLVVKIYHKPEEGNRKAKVISMVAAPPHSSSVAWPLAIVYETSGRFVGYVMPKLDGAHYRQWAELSNARDRRRVSPQFDVKYALMSCRNLVAGVHSVHEVGHIIGDINESNIFVGADTSILIVDTDSAQIKSPNGTVYPCLVGKPEYTAPEISHGSLKDHRRTVQTDTFALGVAIYQMMTGGSHPTDGLYRGAGDPPSTVERIRSGTLPWNDARKGNFESAPRIASECIPRALRNVLEAMLSVAPEQRPSLTSVLNEFDLTLKSLKQCDRVESHWYDVRDGDSCPWCARAENGLPDPWNDGSRSVSETSQKTLSPVSFNDDEESAPPIRRAAPRVSLNTVGTPRNGRQTPPNPVRGSSYQPTAITPQNGSQALLTPPSASPSTQGTYQNQQPEQPPSKIKGKTVLRYADGSYGVRPPLRQLFKSNPKLAFSCVKDETPEIVRCWWSPSRPVARFVPLLVGALLALLVSVGWYYLGIFIVSLIMESGKTVEAIIPMLIMLLSQIAVMTSGIASIILFFSASVDMLKAKKSNNGTLNGYKRDPWWKTILRFVPMTIFFGPLFVVMATVGLALLILNVILNMLTSGVRR